VSANFEQLTEEIGRSCVIPQRVVIIRRLQVAELTRRRPIVAFLSGSVPALSAPPEVGLRKSVFVLFLGRTCTHTAAEGAHQPQAVLDMYTIAFIAIAHTVSQDSRLAQRAAARRSMRSSHFRALPTQAVPLCA